MIRQLSLLVLLVLLAAAPATQPSVLSAADAQSASSLAAEFADRLHRSRYMEGDVGVDVKIPGWEHFPTKQYTYAVTDKDGTKKSAAVVLLDPTADQIARWIVQASIETHGSYSADAGRKAFKAILGQSGGQFPVRGVVYEDILPEDGKNEIYCFHDGVTTAIEGVPHRGTDPMTPDQTKASLGGKVTRVYSFARIQSTSPEMWIAAGGDKAVLGDGGKPTQRWLDDVREAYQAAWTSDRNALMVAWMKGEPK